jgi:hypothetical protein
VKRFAALAVCTLSLVEARSVAAAGRPYAYTQGVDGLPETGIELESWFSGTTPRDSGTGTLLDWWFGPVVGVTDDFEVALYAIFVQAPSGATTGSSIGLGALRLQASYLLAPVGRWPVDVRVRGEIERPFGAGHEDRNNLNAWLTVIASTDLGPLNITANFGSLVEFDPGEPSPWLIFNLGASLDIYGGLRIGAEDFGFWRINDKIVLDAVGPAIGYGIGRLWTTATVGFGIGSDSARYQGRIVVGLSI